MHPILQHLSLLTVLCALLFYKLLLPTNILLVGYKKLIESCSVSQARKQSMLTALQQCRSRSLWHPKINIHAPCCHPVPVAVARHVVCLLSLACVEKAWIKDRLCVCMCIGLPVFLSHLFLFLWKRAVKSNIYICACMCFCTSIPFLSFHLSVYSLVCTCVCVCVYMYEWCFREGRFSCFIGPLFACPVITCSLHCLPLSDPPCAPPHNTLSELTVGGKKSGGEVG